MLSVSSSLPPWTQVSRVLRRSPLVVLLNCLNIFLGSLLVNIPQTPSPASSSAPPPPPSSISLHHPHPNLAIPRPSPSLCDPSPPHCSCNDPSQSTGVGVSSTLKWVWRGCLSFFAVLWWIGSRFSLRRGERYWFWLKSGAGKICCCAFSFPFFFNSGCEPERVVPLSLFSFLFLLFSFFSSFLSSPSLPPL